MENLLGQIVDVVVSKNGKIGKKPLKVCKVKARSVLFIEVDKENRKNIFRKFNKKNIEKVGEKTSGGMFVLIEDGILPDKWESAWDAIGNSSPSVQKYGRFYSNHSKGWASKLTSHFPVKNTTNSSVGFPMV